MRDGEQSPGASMTKEEKLRIARLLERMRVDVIEAGFPASSNGDFEAVKAVAGVIKDSTVAGLCRANDRDIRRGIDALKTAKSGRIHIFIATSALHMEKKLRMTPEQVLEQATLSVRFARKHRDDIEFSPEDGSRSDPDFLCRVLEAVIKEGASTINIPDTVGYAVPEQFGEFIRKLREKVPNSDKAVWSVHCHNDLGMAVANSLAAVTLAGEDAYNEALQRCQGLTGKKAAIFDEDLHALVSDGATAAAAEHWQLVRMSQASGTDERPHAKLVLTEAGKERKADADGDGPVDATFKAIERVAKSGAELLLFSVNAVTQGTESQGEVTVRLAKGGRIVNGVGADTDIVVASAKAYISALNKLESKAERVNPQYQA